MMKLMLTAHATSGLANRGTRAERTRPGQAGTFNANRPAPLPGEEMGAYLRRTRQSDIGATARTRGRTARVVTRTRGRG